MGETHGELCQAPPQLTFDLRGGLPGALQYLVGLKRPTRVEEALCLGERLVRRQREIVGNPFHPSRAVRQRPTQFITWAGVAWAPRGIPVALTVTGWAHRFGSAAASRRYAQ
jgi:hypothetical protein